MTVCQRCIIPESFPDITLDHGICSFCSAHEHSPRLKEPALGREKLLEVLTSKPVDKYHCIVPLSGGKDSSYVLLYIARELGLNPLAVSVDSGLMTDAAKRNIETICRELAVDLIVHKSRFRRKLARESFYIWKHGGKYFSPCLPCETSNRSVAINEATKRKIPYIVWGATDFEDDVSTFSSPDSYTFRQTFAGRADATRKPHEAVKDLVQDMGSGIVYPILKLPISSVAKLKAILHALIYLYYSLLNNLEVNVPEGWKKWLPLAQTSFEGKNVKTIYLFDYLPYDPSEHVETLKREVGWQAPAGKEARLDCKLHSIAAYQFLKETGITLDGFTFSVLVRYGLMSREEAQEKETIIRNSLEKDCEQLLLELGIDGEGML